MRRTPLLVLALLLGCAADSPPEGVEAPGGTDGTPADGTDGTTASDGTDGTASDGTDGTDGTASDGTDGTADGGDGTAPGAGENALADFSLEDLNPSSDTYGQPVSPRDTLEAVSGWYFVHAS
jgi:hypothetical protein